MAYNPNIHHRRSIRLKGYDYSQAGLYFITICVQNRICMFGEIVDGEHMDAPQQMILNDAGKMVEDWYHELENKYPDIKCHEYVVMPNHFHCIIENNGNGNQNIKKKSSSIDDTTIKTGDNVGADLRVCPDDAGNTGMNNTGKTGSGEPVLGETHGLGEPVLGEPVLGEHIGSPLRDVVQWFKTMSTNEYIRGVKTLGWPRFHKKLWQRDYWEHIIRDERSYQNIANYIINNPAKWKNDKFFNQ